jgi:hypothetical protein
MHENRMKIRKGVVGGEQAANGTSDGSGVDV